MDVVQTRHAPLHGQCQRYEGQPSKAATVELSSIPKPVESATSEEFMIFEELQALNQIWSIFGLVVSGLCCAAKDLYYEIIEDMINTEALVMSYECQYSRPSEFNYRDVVADAMSYAEPTTLRAIREGLFADVTPRHVVAMIGRPSCQEYAIDGQVHRIYPYAAVLNPATMQLQVDFSIMRLWHTDVYDSIAYRLKSWHYTSMTGGGFCSVSSLKRSQYSEDVVTDRSAPKGSRALLEPKPVINGISKQRGRWRHRRVTGDEIGLPKTEYPFVAEYRWVSSSGEEQWLVWTNGDFYALKSPLHWSRLPVDDNGNYKPLGWKQIV